MIPHLILHTIIIHLLHLFNNMQILSHVYITLETQQYGYTM